MSACTVNDTFAGIPLGECGHPAVDTITSACPDGHTERTPMCAEHKSALLDSDMPLMCPGCTEAGTRGFLAVTR